jgi:hypothetical protein
MIARFGPVVPTCLIPSHVFDPMRLSLCPCLWSGWPGYLPETVPSEAACPEATAQRPAYRSPAEPVLRAFTCPYVHAGYSHWQSPWDQVFTVTDSEIAVDFPASTNGYRSLGTYSPANASSGKGTSSSVDIYYRSVSRSCTTFREPG